MLRKIREMLRCEKGFTLVELLAVVAVIAVLAAMAIPRFSAAADNASAAKVLADLRNIDSAIASALAANPGVTGFSTDGSPASGEVDLTTYFQNGWPTPPSGFGTAYAVANNSGIITINGTVITSTSTMQAIIDAKNQQQTGDD